MLLLVLLAGLVVTLLSARPGVPRGAQGKALGRKGPSPLWLLGAVVFGVICLRFGVNWLVVAGGVLLAAARSLLPLLRFLPVLQRLRQKPPSASSGNGSTGSGARSGSGPVRAPRMSRHEALQVLGLDANASRDDVQREYRRLMKKLHPDLGGSSYLAAKLNEAKDVLL